MNKTKKQASIIIIFFAIIITSFYIFPLENHGRAGTDMSKTDLNLAGWVAGESADLKYMVAEMITSGVLPENITFTGAKTSNDFFGSGKMDIKMTAPVNGICSPPCTAWTFLPASKKDYGWYVYGVGTSAADIIAYLPNVTPRVCSEIQSGSNIKRDAVPPKQAGAPFDPTKAGIYLPQGGATTIKSQDHSLDGKFEGCFENRVGDGPSSFSYYSVLYAQ